MKRVVTVLLGVLAACGDAQERPQPQGPATPGLPDPPHSGSMALRIGAHRLDPGQEEIVCWSRTLDNEQPLYVEAVRFENLGSFHHSNWFVVPEDVYAGPDGTWDCSERDFEELSAALSGGVLFAQSTQAWTEEQRFNEGAVIKIPAHAKIVADLHLLNLSPTTRDTEAWLEIDVVHPAFVRTVLKPLMLAYYDLSIPGETESRFSAECTGLPPIDLHYALPHYHSTGNFFSLELLDEDVEPLPIFSIEGFSADVVGQTFATPASFGAYGTLRFTCGYDNWMNQDLHWGIGVNEMCVMLGLAETDRIVTATVLSGTEIVEVVDGVHHYASEDCTVLTAPVGEAYALPRVGELAAPLYLPPVDPRDQDAPPLPECVDADPTARPAAAATLDNLREYVFEPWCTFSACHGEGAASGIDLRADDLEAVLRGDDELRPRVVPGDPDASVLYQVLAQCNPDVGGANNHMPRNAPVLLDDALVAMVRAWIENLPAE